MSFLLQKKDFVVSKREFARVVKVPFERAFSIPNIKAGFAKCGIYPYNPKAIDQSKVAPSLTCSSSSLDDSMQAQMYPAAAALTHLQVWLCLALMTLVCLV